MKRADEKLSDLHAKFVLNRPVDQRAQCENGDRNQARSIQQLARRGISTVSDLIDSLPTLPQRLRDSAMWLLCEQPLRDAEKLLFALLRKNPSMLLDCAFVIGMMKSRRVTREFIRIGKAQLALPSPDRKCLEAVIHGLKMAIVPEAEEVLLTIYERTDLPGWVRGDAGDALGCCSQLSDRRTRFFRRALTTALNGLDDADIEVQFWSMYVLMQLAQNYSSNPKRANARFAVVLPRLRKIAATDHRLAPGYWWPMSGEAEDAIYIIKHGNGREKDAAERWLGNKKRGPVIRE